MSTTNVWCRRVLPALLMLGTLTIMQTAGCSEVKISGKTASDVFQNPQTLALVEAACHGDLAKVDALVKQGTKVNATGYRDTSVLAWVMLCKNYAGMEKLLELGANPNYKMEGDMSPVWLAAGSPDPKLLPILLAHGGDPNIWAGSDNALMIAMEQGRKQNFQMLLEHGANINAHDSGGNTVATYAAALAKFDVVELLLRRGYNYELQRLALGVSGRVVSSDVAAEKQRVLDMLKARGVKFPLPTPQIAPPAPGTKPPPWWHPHSAGTSGAKGK